jgi:hypothetical protein
MYILVLINKSFYQLLILGQTPEMPSRAGGTRWVGHQLKAVEDTISGYPVIVNHLSQVKKSMLK